MGSVVFGDVFCGLSIGAIDRSAGKLVNRIDLIKQRPSGGVSE